MKAKRKTKLFEWQQIKHGECQRCHKIKDLNVDHIIPVHLMQDLGLIHEAVEDEENFEHTCYVCNRFKGARIDINHPKTKYLLLKYINKI